MSIALEAGAEDMKRGERGYEITSDPTTFNQVKEALEKAGVVLLSADLTQGRQDASRLRPADRKKSGPVVGRSGRQRRRAVRLFERQYL